MSGPSLAHVTEFLAGQAGSSTALNGSLQGTGDEFGSWFEELLADLVAGYGQLPVSAVVLVVAAILGAFLVPWLVAVLHSLADRQPLGGRGMAAADRLRSLVPTSFSELVLRTVQVTVAILAALALVVVWGYGDVVVDLRRAIASDLGDVIGLSITMALIAMAFVGSDLLKRLIERFGETAQGFTQHQQEIALRIGQITLFLTLGAAILTLWSFDLSGLLVGAGFLGIVVGFAARETLGSLIAGFVLMFSRPFTIGDWVEIDDVQGTITDITMFNTRLQNIDAETIVIPNDVVANSTIVNRSRRGRLQIRREVGIDYDSDPATASDTAVDAMGSVEVVADSPEPKALPVRFGDSAIVLELRFWITDPSPQRKWAAIADVLRAVKGAFDEEDLTIPFPQRTLSGREDADVAPVVATQRSLEDGDGETPAGEESAEGVAANDETEDGEADDRVAEGDEAADRETEGDEADDETESGAEQPAEPGDG